MTDLLIAHHVTGDFKMYQKNVILTEENEDNQNPNYFLLFYDVGVVIDTIMNLNLKK